MNFLKNISKMKNFQKFFYHPNFQGIYFDFQATTVIDPRVLDIMLPYQLGKFGNPHSITHSFGNDIMDKVNEARGYVADLICSDPKEVIFTSGATESNNLAIKGTANEYLKKTGKNHIITTTIEHKCVQMACKELERSGKFDVTYLPVQTNGLIDINELRDAINEKTFLFSGMGVNNEIGVIQPLKEIGELCKENDVIFHTDCAQAVGKIPLDVEEMNIDMMSMSSHKLYGPKGIGALYVKKRKPKIRIKPIISGGGQERGLRSGTLPSFLCIGFGEACKIAKNELERDTKHVEELFNVFHDRIMNELDDVYLNGDINSRYKGNLSLSFAFVEGESLLLGLNEIYLSSGSACTSATLETSHVLKAINISDELAHTSIRFGIGRFTTKDEVNYVVDRIVEEVNRLRDISPLYDMHKKGIDISNIDWGDSHGH